MSRSATKSDGRRYAIVSKLRSRRIFLKTFLLLVIALVLAIAMAFRAFHVAWEETPLARISVAPIKEQHAFVRLTLPDEQEFASEIRSSRWQVDAYVLLWEDWLLKLGVRPLVVLVGLGPKHLPMTPPSSFNASGYIALSSESAWLLDLLRYLEGKKKIPGVRGVYGSAVFHSLAEGDFALVLKGPGLALIPQ